MGKEQSNAMVDLVVLLSVLSGLYGLVWVDVSPTVPLLSYSIAYPGVGRLAYARVS